MSPSMSQFQVVEVLEPRRMLSAAPVHPPSAAGRDLTVMTQNLYLGADIGKLAQAQSLLELPGIVNELWETVQKTDFPKRAEAIADEIAAAQPQLIGLQEAALWRVQEQGDWYLPGGGTPATDVKYDFIQILIDELAERGLSYKVASSVQETDIEFPNALPIGPWSDIRYTDRDAILARTDIPASQLKIEGTDAGLFNQTLPLPLPGGAVLEVPRGWTSVDAKVRGKTVHVVEAHTETFSELVQYAQIQELIVGPADSDLPTILMGDFNSDADATPPWLGYQMLRGAGFDDVWSETQIGPGPTWGTDELVRDLDLTQRLDLVLFKNGIKAQSSQLVLKPLPSSPTGPLWASDHAGLVATVEISVNTKKATRVQTKSQEDLEIKQPSESAGREVLAEL